MPVLKKRVILMFQYILARLNETSTLRGLILLVATLTGCANPEKLDVIVTVAGLAIGAIGAFLPELIVKPKKKPDQKPNP